MYKSIRRIDYLIPSILFGVLFCVLNYIWLTEKQDRFFTVFIFGLAIVLVSCLRVYFSIPIIRISDKYIFFKNKKYDVKDIENIELLSKVKAPFLWTTYDSKGVLIQLKNGITLSFDEENYHNFRKLRQLLANLKEHNYQTHLETIKFDLNYKTTERLKEYIIIKSNNWKTLSTLLIYMLVLTGYAWLKSKVTDVPEAILPISIGVILLMIVVQGRETYFIKYSDKEIIFLNSIWFWVRQEFEFKNIRQFEKINIQKIGEGFRLVDENYKVHNFGCSTIKTQTLEELEKFVNERKINIS